MNTARRSDLRAVVLAGLLGLGATVLVWVVTTIAARQALLPTQMAAPTTPAIDDRTDRPPPAAMPPQQIAVRRADRVGRQAAACVAILAVITTLATWIGRQRAAGGRARLTQMLEAIRQGDLDTPQRSDASLPQPWRDLVRMASEGRSYLQGERARLDADRRRGFQVLGHMVEGVIAVDHQSRVVLLNPAARHLLGLTRRSLIGRRLVEVVRVPQLIEATQGVLHGQESGEVQVEIEADGQRRPLRVQITTLPDGRSSGALVTLHDESQARRLEQLRRDFVANVSHELKTPLAAIKGYVETVQVAAPDDPQAAEYFLSQISVQCLRLERLINDMLQLARAQSGPAKLTLNAVSLMEVAEEAVKAHAALARTHAVDLSIDSPASSLTVRADREALLTICNNLIGNAIRYTTAQGAVRVRFRDQGERVALVVEDTGIGIPPRDQARVFERFYRVDQDRESAPEGTGLGLAIVKHLVQSLQGEVQLISRPGEGSTFEVLLPAAPAGNGPPTALLATDHPSGS